MRPKQDFLTNLLHYEAQKLFASLKLECLLKIPSKHCIVGPMLARCSFQHFLTSARRCSQCWGDAVLHQSPAFSQHWHSAAGRHRNLRRSNNGGIMFQRRPGVGKLQLTNTGTAASQHWTTNCSKIQNLRRSNNGGIMLPTLEKSSNCS